MKTGRFDYLYLMFGILCGFLLGTSLDRETGMWVGRVLSVGTLSFLALRGRRIEARAHTDHLEHWEELRTRGKWYFVLSRYVLFRGIVLLVMFVGLPVSGLTSSVNVTGIVALVGTLLVPMLLYIGHQEWNDCEREIEIRSLRQTAEFISSKQN